MVNYDPTSISRFSFEGSLVASRMEVVLGLTLRRLSLMYTYWPCV